MRPPKSEPYQRSRHRAALHAWVVAATAVASIGMPSLAAARNDQLVGHQATSDELAPTQTAEQAARAWFDALQKGDSNAALSSMTLPGAPGNERAVRERVRAMSDWLNESGTAVEPVAHNQAGHWALSAWRLGEDVLLEPVTLYDPTADGLFLADASWQVVPQGFANDSALKPLYNADHESLMQWFETLE